MALKFLLLSFFFLIEPTHLLVYETPKNPSMDLLWVHVPQFKNHNNRRRRNSTSERKKENQEINSETLIFVKY